MTRVAGAVAVVTGGASGIGLGIARQLRDAGAEVVIADIEQGAIDRAAAELDASGPAVTGIRVDVSDLVSVRALAEEVLARFGRVDIVVNNAGVGPLGAIKDLTIQDWRWLIDVNLYGVIHGVTVFLPLLEANAEGGRIVNTASQAAFDPIPTMGAYSATKFGVAALTEVLSAELAADGSKVGATLLAPGPVFSNIKDSSRNRPAGQAGGLRDEDLAALVDTSDWLHPDDVGRIVVRAIEDDVDIAPTHPGMLPAVEARFDRIRAAYRRYPTPPPVE